MIPFRTTEDFHPALASGSCARNEHLLLEYRRVRSLTESLCDGLAIEDFVIQSMPDASPLKWHLAHTTWFFEQFVAGAHAANQEIARASSYLFNSYYNLVGPMHPRDKRGLLSRPTVKEVLGYRQAVDRRVEELLLDCDSQKTGRFEPLVRLGLNHEQQHQELMLTDLKHLFAQNPLRPVYATTAARQPASDQSAPITWHEIDPGIYRIGNEGEGNFCFDNELPAHRQYVERFSIGSRLVTNGEYLAFIEDRGYERPDLWLAAGWDAARAGGWFAPLYWEERDGSWWSYDLSGMRPVAMAEPVAHVSYFEADAFARWSNARLPTEAEWEIVAKSAPRPGNFLDSGTLHPLPAESAAGPQQFFGDVWEWTASSYSPYPGYKPGPGALGEYNGKFMCNQYVLRGGSCVTPSSHIRATYRNFFAPEKRWQFSGIRLARDL